MVVGVECGDSPEVLNGRISSVPTATIQNNAVVTYECLEGFQFVEGNGHATSITCLGSGNWSEESVLCSKLMFYVPHSFLQRCMDTSENYI